MAEYSGECRVLMVDDSADDLVLISTALQACGRLRVVAQVENGRQALAYLNGQEPYSDRQRFPFPDLLLVDLRMPLMDGFELLGQLQQHPFPNLQIAVLAELERKEDISRAFALGAHFFQTKQLGMANQVQMLKLLEQQVLQRISRPAPDAAHPLTPASLALAAVGTWEPGRTPP